MTTKFWFINLFAVAQLLPCPAWAQIPKEPKKPAAELQKIELPKIPTVPILPEEITAAEADYERRQQAIEAAMAKTIRTHLDRPAEERRDILLSWMERQRPVLEEQVARSAAIDALYVSQGIVFSAPALETSSQTSTEDNPAVLQARFKDNPEALREALRGWMKRNGDQLKRKKNEVSTSPGTHLSARLPTSALPPVPAAPALRNGAVEAPAGSLQALEQELNQVLASCPPPVPKDGEEASRAVMEQWRTNITSKTGPLMRNLMILRTQETLKLEQKIASEAQNNE